MALVPECQVALLPWRISDLSRPAIFPITPARVLTPIFVITNRRNAFTVLGLIFICCAISLLVSPCTRYFIASRSRRVRLYFSDTSYSITSGDVVRSSRIATLSWLGPRTTSGWALQTYRRRPETRRPSLSPLALLSFRNKLAGSFFASILVVFSFVGLSG